MNLSPEKRIEKMIQEDEGGWVFTNRADDSGGPTYGGMTWRTFDRWQQGEFEHKVTYKPFTQSDFKWAARHGDKNLQRIIVKCYHDEFWLSGHVYAVSEFAQQMYLSACVNMGLKEALKCLQIAVNAYTPNVLLVDGHWGPKTAAALNRDFVFEDEFKLAFSDAVMERYIRIVQRNARAVARGETTVRQWENLMGWFNRAISYRNK